MTKTVLAVIRVKDSLSIDEAIVVSARASIGVFDLYKRKMEWTRNGKPTEAFTTSKDLKTLEKELKEKGMTVYLESCGTQSPQPSAEGLHERETTKPQIIQRKAQRDWVCASCDSTIRKGEINYMTATDTWSHYCQRCHESIKTQKVIEPLMLAVFGDESEIRRLLE